MGSRAQVINPPAVAIIDDDFGLVRAIERILQSNYKCVVYGYPSVEDFLLSVDKNEVDDVALILLDFHLPGQNGPKLVDELRKRKSSLLTHSYILGMTGDSERLVHNEFQDAGIEEIIVKPLQQFDFSRISKVAHSVNQKVADIAYSADPKQDALLQPNIIKKYI